MNYRSTVLFKMLFSSALALALTISGAALAQDSDGEDPLGVENTRVLEIEEVTVTGTKRDASQQDLGSRRHDSDRTTD